MKKGFHWFSALEWAFIGLLVLLSLGMAADGFSERGVLDAISRAFFTLLEIVAAVLSLPAAIIGFSSGLGPMAFFGLFIIGLWLFRERVLEMGAVALVMLLLLVILFSGIYAV